MPLLRLLPLLLLISTGQAQDEDWLGLDAPPPVLIGFELGRDEADDESQAFSAILPLGSRVGFYGAYGKTELDDGQQSFDSYSLASTVWLEVSQMLDFELRHFFEGNDDELENELVGMALFVRPLPWHFRIHLDAGELLIFTRDEITDFLNTIPGRIQSDVLAYEVALGWQGRRWYWEAAYREYDYDLDLRPLQRSDFARFVVKSSALAQSSLLILSDTSLALGLADFDNDYSLLLSQERSALDREYYDTLTLSWEHWASDTLGLLMASSFPAESDDFGLTLGLRWVL